MIETLRQNLIAGLLIGILTLTTILLNVAIDLKEYLFQLANKPTPELTFSGSGTDVSECFPIGGASTTTGITYFSSTAATTTLISSCPINRATDLSFNYIAGATSTTNVDFTYQFSHDGGTWFSESNITLTSNELTTLATGSSTPRRLSLTNGTTTRTLPLLSVASRYMRVQAKANGGSGAYLWATVSKREGNN